MNKVKSFVNDIDSAKYYDKLMCYSKELLDFINDNYFLKHNNNIVCEIGSGTGILSKDLLKYDIKFIGVEPDINMKEVSDYKLNKYTNYSSVLGNCYDTKLDDNSINYVFVAQALHLFDISKFKIECNRILKNSDNIFIIWNRYDFQKEVFNDMLNVLINVYPTCSFRYSKDNFNEDFKTEVRENILSCIDLYDGEIIQKTFDNSIYLDESEFLDFALSFELYPLHGLKNICNTIKDKKIDIDTYKSEMINIFNKYKVNNKIKLPITTDLVYSEYTN